MTKLANVNFADNLVATVYGAMIELIRRDAQTPEVWTHRAARIKIHGLLNFKTPSRHKPKEIVIEQDRMDDVRYRRSLVRKLKAPRPGKWNYHNVDLDRNRLLTDETYLTDMVKVMSYRWVEALLPINDPSDAIVLLKQDAGTLEFCLDRLGPHQVSSWMVAGVMMRRMAEELVDKNELFLAGVASIRKVADEERAKLADCIKQLREETLVNAGKAFDGIAANACAEADEFLVGLHARMAETGASCQKTLDESAAQGDEETRWRAQLAASAAKRKEERKSWSFLGRLFG